MNTSTALRTDRYELTMLEAAITHGTADTPCMFEAFGRRLPGARRYGVVAGIGRLLERIRDFRFGDAELAWLSGNEVVNSATLDWLADYRFSGDIWGYAEGEAYFPESPILIVESSFGEGVLLETLILSILNYDSAVAAAATRMVTAAADRPLAEMGSRRTHEDSAVAAARAAYIAGFSATSNLEAGRTWGIPTMGTAAHSFTLLHESEEEAFRAQIAASGPETTLLVDTYDIARGVETAIRVAGTELGAIRLDSGDLPTLVVDVRRQLDKLGAHDTKITVTSDLDEYAIATLRPAPVDSYGVGTSLVTGSGSPAAGLVYKLVARQRGNGEWVSVAKASTGKASIGGRKYATRVRDENGVARQEKVYIGLGPEDADALPSTERPLLQPLMTAGDIDDRHVGVAGTRRAREHHAMVRSELPAGAFRLGRGDPALPTTFDE
ncbi:nicotinate phosphoribosyltransferase [Paramicrobacterium agarici]|uniref:Nicotinate phosphoribosyltransferase n=1 Tax=Paramicrobacterium agarici TaxID=630514 RepID=A0A2A9DZ73_9MICO|nr:nicotinate phosphoribosyltransferase [Microbacterium agarici]PFG31621.1 nicotinate phosphoribosyltransferase [Microbacterium agarici]